MYQLFTYCLPTIICVMLMSIVFFYYIFAVCLFLFIFSMHVLLYCFCGYCHWSVIVITPDTIISFETRRSMGGSAVTFYQSTLKK